MFSGEVCSVLATLIDGGEEELAKNVLVTLYGNADLSLGESEDLAEELGLDIDFEEQNSDG